MERHDGALLPCCNAITVKTYEFFVVVFFLFSNFIYFRFLFYFLSFDIVLHVANKFNSTYKTNTQPTNFRRDFFRHINPTLNRKKFCDSMFICLYLLF